MNGSGLKQAGRFLALGFELAGSVLGGGVVGWFADEWLGSGPFLFIGLTLLGMVGAVYRVLWMLRRKSAGAGSEAGNGG